MARLIEFFTRTGELVLDPFAGVGGTLLGAAIARGPRRAIGIELDPRWAAVFAETVAALRAERDGAGPRLADLGPTDPGGRRGVRPVGDRAARSATRASSCATLADASVDFVATDPPYNVQLPMTMAGGKLAEAHANRRTDYAMVSDLAEDLANLPDYAGVPRRDERGPARGPPGRCGPAATRSSSSATPTRAAATCSPRPTSRRAAPRRASCPRATSRGTRPGRGCGRTATRGRSCPTSRTSTSWCCARRPSPAARPEEPAGR